MNNNTRNQESLLKQNFDNFDVQNIGLGIDEYKKYAMSVPISETNKLLEQDFSNRFRSHQNLVMSASGQTGSGKSSFLSSLLLKASKIKKQVLNLPYDPFCVENVYYEPEDLKARINNNLRYGEILLRDEHLKGNAGSMSDLVSSFLMDAEMQLRKNMNDFAFASPREEDHAHFFVFEIKNQILDSNGFPRAIVAMLKTPRYTDPESLVWRGLCAFPFPPMDYWKKYEARKDEHILKLKAQYGNNYAPVDIDAVNIYKKYHDELIVKTRDRIVKPIKDNLMKTLIGREIGTRKYTNDGYNILRDEIKDFINKEFSKSNLARMKEIEDTKLNNQLEKRELVQMQLDESRRIKEAKMIAFQEKLKEDKNRNELKRRALDIREQELARNREVKIEKENEKQKQVEEKRKKMLEQGNPANHFAEELA